MFTRKKAREAEQLKAATLKEELRKETAARRTAALQEALRGAQKMAQDQRMRTVTGPAAPTGPVTVGGYISKSASAGFFADVNTITDWQWEVDRYVEAKVGQLLHDQNVLIATMQEQIDEIWEELRGA